MNQTEIRRINKKLDELSTDIFTIREFKRSASRNLGDAQRRTNPDDVARVIKDVTILSGTVSSTLMTLDGADHYLDHAISELAVIKNLLKQGGHVMTKQSQLSDANFKLKQLADRVNELISLNEVMKWYFDDGIKLATAINGVQKPTNAEWEQLCQQLSDKLYNSSQLAETMRRLARESEDIQAWLGTFLEDLAEVK